MRALYKTLTIFILLQGASGSLFSQRGDSILRLADDTVKLSLLKKEAIAISEDDPDYALLLASAGIDLAKKLNQPVAEGECYKAAGVAYDVKGRLDSCLYFLEAAKKVFTRQQQPTLLANTISDIGLAYYLRGIYEVSLRNHFDALSIREQVGDKSLISKSYNNIGLVYRARKDYPDAISYYLKSLAIKKELGDSAGQLNSLMNIGSSYQYQRQYDSALYYGKLTLSLSRQINKPKDEANSLANIGVAYAGLLQPDAAENNLVQALEKATAIDYKEPMYSIFEGMGNIMLGRNKYDEALKWFNKGVLLASERKRKEMLANYYNNLAECYEKKGDYNLAYNFIRNSEAIRDSLLNEENLRQINEMNAVYETSKKEEKIDVLSKEGKQKEAALIRSKRERNYFVIAAILFSALAGLAFYAYRNNRKQKELLNRQKAIIEISLKEKETLLREIHHRVKNNLQIISGLLNLQSRQIENPEAQEAVREGRNRVKSMALIHQKLYQQDNLTGVNMKEYLDDLVNTIQQTFRDKHTAVKAVIQCNNLSLDVDTAIPLGLIINELITNCYKYAFTGKTNGQIIIRLEEEQLKLILEVKDDGAGFPEGFELNATRSFGMKLVQSLAAKLEAHIEHRNENGAVFKLTISNYQPV
jgi:two-component system, sensor histidine kinase PdtaS